MKHTALRYLWYIIWRRISQPLDNERKLFLLKLPVHFKFIVFFETIGT